MTQRRLLAGLIEWDRPEGIVRLIDGGHLTVDGEQFTSRDDLLGAIVAFEALSEGVADELPSGRFTFAPPQSAVASDLSHGGLQGTRLRTWIAEIDQDTGLVVGVPDLQLDAIIDVTWMRLERGTRLLDVDFTSSAERLVLANIGNVLSGEFHRRIYPGENGLNNCIAVSTVFAWGVASAPRGVASGGGGGGFGSGGGFQDRQVSSA